jgi:hypothetical protein
MPFLVLRPDHDLLVLPARYLAEIRQIPSSRLNLIEAEYNVRTFYPRSRSHQGSNISMAEHPWRLHQHFEG